MTTVLADQHQPGNGGAFIADATGCEVLHKDIIGCDEPVRMKHEACPDLLAVVFASQDFLEDRGGKDHPGFVVGLICPLEGQVGTRAVMLPT